MDLIKYPIDTLDLDGVIVRLGEECAEVLKEIFKGQRFGWDAVNPKDGTTPMERLISEAKDVKKCLTEFRKRIKNGEHK